MLPRLLYVGDVPVEASYHGSSLLHRLLSGYPSEQLIVIETARRSEPSRRLPKVHYIGYSLGRSRWLNTRFHPYAVAWFSEVAAQVAPKITQPVKHFDFEGVLTVAHGFGWLAAAGVARRKKVPLHLMMHDDWPRVADILPSWRRWLDQRFANVYRQAQSRWCVSPSMSRDYNERYGKAAEVIYPSRARDCPEYDGPPARLARHDQPFTIAFAGTINSKGYVEALRALQKALRQVGGRLLIFGPLTSDEAQHVNLDDPNTEVCGFASWSDILLLLRTEADALFVPMSFDDADRANMKMAFPSKLADYTATGLPLLIYGPDYCSAVAWARANPDVAEIVEAEDQLTKAVQRLANDPAHRIALGKRALEVGRQYFTHEQVQQVFLQALSV